MAESDEVRRIGATEYVAPAMNRRAFHCPHCLVYAQQAWWHLLHSSGHGGYVASNIYKGKCLNCRELTYWWTADINHGTTAEPHYALMVIPEGSTGAPLPHPDFPEEPKADFQEARAIVDRSPRGATALLRLAVQKLCQALGEPGKNLNTDIAALVRQGLLPGVQQALDSLRVIGNNAVHPGQLDLRDDVDTATALFDLLNYIVEQMITRPKELQGIYGRLPPDALAAIQARDTGSSPAA
jgi:hypothetical protein